MSDALNRAGSDTNRGRSGGVAVETRPATLLREIAVLWEYDGSGGYVWRAIEGAKRDAGRADTANDAWSDALRWCGRTGADPS